MTEDAELVIAARSGEHDAFGLLVERWFDRCWEVAWRILHDRDLAADVAQDTLLTAWQQLDRLQQPASFGGWVLRITRNRALDRLARERRAVPTAEHEHLEPPVSGNDPTGPEAAFARAQERDLVWAAAAALGERDASLLDLHLRHGLEPAELAVELGIAANAAHQALFRLRRRLGQAVRAWLLWRDDAPTCVVLRAELAAAGHTTFGAATVRTVRRHVTTCETCAEEHDRVAAPAALFSIVPLVAAPALLRARALVSLASAGVPVAAGADAEVAADVTTPADGGSGGGGDSTALLHAADGHSDAWDAQTLASSRGRRLLAGTAVTLVALAILGGVQWWRGSAAPASVVRDDVPVAPLPFPSREPTVRDAPLPPAADAQPSPVDPPRPAEPTAPAPTPSPSQPTVPRPPEITDLRAVFVGTCPPTHATTSGPNAGLFELTWLSERADTATLTDAAGVAAPVPASGTARRCAQRGAVFTLDVVGAGGTATRTVEVVPPVVE